MEIGRRPWVNGIGDGKIKRIQETGAKGKQKEGPLRTCHLDIAVSALYTS